MRKILISLAIVTTAITAAPVRADPPGWVVPVITGFIGYGIGRSQANREQNVYGNGYPPVYPPQPYGTRNMTVPAPVYVNQAPPMYAQVPQPEVVMPYCDEQYYEGEYNPPAARSFCQGQRARIQRDLRRQQAEAYRRGADGY